MLKQLKRMGSDFMHHYVRSGKDLMLVRNIDKLRDGGTILIDTTKGEFYIDKTYENFHNGYPLTDENKIDDQLTIDYLILLFSRYLERKEDEILRLKGELVLIKNNNGK